MKRLILPLLLTFSYMLAAQTIPGAQQQPQWAMPFYFEDANGEKDTVWIGYDPESSLFPSGYDAIYNEWQWIDTSKFQAVLFPRSYSPFMTLPKDSAWKVDIQSYHEPFIQVGFRNGKMPVTMKWDNSHFYSDSLPYPDISPRPRARADMTCGNKEPPYFYCYTGTPSYPFVLTDQPRPYFKYVAQDSFLFDGSGNMPPDKATGLNITILPYEAYYLSVEENSASLAHIYPNPFAERLHVHIPHPEQGILLLKDISGKVVWQGEASGQEELLIDASLLPAGVYIFHYYSKTTTFNKKLIKR